MKQNLTINYGVRYELFSPVLNTKNALANFTSANGGAIVSAQDGGWYERSTIHPDKNDWAPRVGFSYQPSSRVVVRGGYGTFYQHSVRIGSSAVIGLNPPFVIDGQIDQQVGSTTPLFQLQNGFPADQFTPALVDLTKLQTTGAGSRSADWLRSPGELRTAVLVIGEPRARSVLCRKFRKEDEPAAEPQPGACRRVQRRWISPGRVSVSEFQLERVHGRRESRLH